MASTISTWYHNQYSTWNRTRRMQAPPYLARPETQTSRVTRAASRGDGDAVINMGDLLPPPSSQTTDKKKHDTLFGPSIGVVNPGPEWADQKPEQSEKSQLQDVLTSELVSSWVEKSKEASQPTTTLQALVNLKRPSLRLSPISHDDSDDPTTHPQQHGLEFQFDCDAPKCGISVHIITTQLHKDTPAASSSTRLIEVFHTAVDGGFGHVLKLEEGAVLELDKYDAAPDPAAAADASVPAPPAAPAGPAVETPKKRFTLRVRKRTHPHATEDTTHVSVAGPALQVVDVETPSPGTSAGAGAGGEGSEKEAGEKDEGGVRVLIRLEALDANEHTLASANSQATYLHIVRLGPAPIGGAAASTTDTRPWVVRVVKREATIGPHTFHLHEIYGLTSHSAPTQASESHLPAPGTGAHTYPPPTGGAGVGAGVGMGGGVGVDDDPTSECLLCLSSPREVVLLPCRHLVACKECAVNMVEFGAGGQLVHGEEGVGAGDANASANANANANAGETLGDTAGGNAEGEAGATGAAGTGAGAATPTVRATTTTRRKRKAKGWFCPVCRQPYTSLLRISTVAPGKVKVAGGDVGVVANVPVSAPVPVSAAAPGSTTALFAAQEEAPVVDAGMATETETGTGTGTGAGAGTGMETEKAVGEAADEDGDAVADAAAVMEVAGADAETGGI